MPIRFRCSTCGRLLQVGDEAAGKNARCPGCGTNIPIPWESIEELPLALPIPSESDEAQPSSREADYSQAEEAEEAEERHRRVGKRRRRGLGLESRRTRASSRVFLPALFLIILASAHVVLTLVSLPLYLKNLDELVAIRQKRDQRRIPEGELNQMRTAYSMGLITGSVVVVISGTIVVIGAVQMARLRNYGLAMTAAVLSVIPCTSPCCCLLGMPVGIWAFTVLRDPDVKDAFL